MINNEYLIWEEKYKKAFLNTQKYNNNTGILIEVASQHPLIDGIKPNQEFKARLDYCIKLYCDLKKENNNVKIYIPGSIHYQDKISLSEAGKNYLLNNNINKEDIFSDDANKKYKGKDGVYNSSDECYVSVQLFKDLNYQKIYSICSPAQLMRKAFSYIEFGIIPQLYSVPVENMFHNYIDEYFNKIPELIKDGNGLQGNSLVAKQIRENRMPKNKKTQD